MATREQLTSYGFILVAIGSAVGLGNIWRFPYLVGSSGGGAFFIPYLIGVVLLGYPVILFEIAMGRHFKKGIISTFAKINPKWKYLGLVLIGTTLLVLSYYLVIAGWTLAYTLFSANRSYPLFSDFTAGLGSILFFIIMGIITAGIVLRGIENGIEKTARILMPLLFLALGALLIYAFTLPGLSEGLKFYLAPDLSMLSNPAIWIAGFGQALFSISAGRGIMLTFGSYLNKKSDIPRSAVLIIFIDTLVAIVAGLIIFPIVFSFGMNPAAGPELAFVTLTKIFEIMPFGHLLGVVFFFLLFIGALTSAITVLEVPVTAFIEEFKISRKKATAIAISIVFSLGIWSALSYSSYNLTLFGKPLLDVIDYIAASILVIVSTLIITLYISKHKLLDRLIREINWHTKIYIPKFYTTLFHIVVPALLFTILAYGFAIKFIPA